MEPSQSLGGIRRVAATALLAVGLLVVGGVTVVNAADPAGSPAPNATTQPSGGGTAPGGTAPNGTQPQGGAPTHAKGNCPNMGGSGSSGSGSGGSSTPSTGTSSPAPNT